MTKIQCLNGFLLGYLFFIKRNDANDFDQSTVVILKFSCLLLVNKSRTQNIQRQTEAHVTLSPIISDQMKQCYRTRTSVLICVTTQNYIIDKPILLI